MSRSIARRSGPSPTMSSRTESSVCAAAFANARSSCRGRFLRCKRIVDTSVMSPFEGRWHKLDCVGLNRLPAAPIPIWLGGEHERAIRRAVKLADGFILLHDRATDLPRVREYLRDSCRDPAAFGIAARMAVGRDDPEAWVREANELLEAAERPLVNVFEPERIAIAGGSRPLLLPRSPSSRCCPGGPPLVVSKRFRTFADRPNRPG